MLRNPKKNESYIVQRYAQCSKDVQGFIDELVDWKSKDFIKLFPGVSEHHSAAQLLGAIVSMDIFEIKGTNVLLKYPPVGEPSPDLAHANAYLIKYKTLKPFLEPLKIMRERTTKLHTLTYNQKLELIESVMDDLSTLLLRLELALNKTSWNENWKP